MTKEELERSIRSIVDLYKRAYDRDIECDIQSLVDVASKSGFLLRTKIRAVIEALDQIYQYGNMGSVEAGKVQGEDLSEVIESYFNIPAEE